MATLQNLTTYQKNMPVQIESAIFTDIFGNTLPYYQANAGDQVTAKVTVRSAMRLTTLTAPLTLDPILNQVTSPVVSWLDEGFRVGDWVKVTRHSSGGNQQGQPFWTLISYVDDVVADFSQFPFWYNQQNGQFLVFLAVEGNGSNVPRGRADLDVLLNHVSNTQNGSEFSLIDGEATRSTFQGVEAMAPLATIAGNIVGFQSGQFLISSEIKRLADNSDSFRVHEILLTFVQSGAYDSSLFDSSNCLKAYFRLEWASLTAEPFDRSITLYNSEANTGFFNQANNTSVANSTVIQGINELTYCIGQNALEVIVDGPIAGLGIGFMYISTDPDYYKNRPFPQQEITMLLKSTDIAPAINVTESNEFGANYQVQVANVVSVGTVSTITLNVGPNQEFIDFMTAREDGDRRVVLWIKCGTANLTIFDGQMSCTPPVGGPLVMAQDFGYLDHSQNVETAAGDNVGFIADTEDDIAYLGTFLLDKGKIYDSFEVEVEAFETTALDSFNLQSAFFSFAGVQISNDGRYLLNELANTVNTLPTTSAKINASLTLDPSLDTLTQYGVKIYAPWLLNWKYWLPQQNANVDFYPTQNKNWEQYDNLADWQLRTTLTIIEDGLAYTHSNAVVVAPYDNEADIISLIEIFDEGTLNPITVIPTNSLIRIKSTHTNNAGDWDQGLTWGMITIEPHENESRFICSSVVEFDNNNNNPLTPLAGLLIVIDYPAPNVAVMECVLDSSKIDLIKGVDIGAKIKEKDKEIDGFLLTISKEAAGAYSVMKVSSDNVYNGPIIRIRRVNGDEMDFFGVFDGTNIVINEDEILAFVGSTLADFGTVTTWYDQSGTGFHATQTILADQPVIVSQGVLIKDPANGFPALDFDGANQYFLIPLISAASDYLQAFQFARTTALFSNRVTAIGNIESIYPNPFAWQGTTIFDFVGINSGVNNVHAAGQSQIGSFLNLSYRKLNNSINMRQNGVQLATISEDLTAGQSYISIGRLGAAYHFGGMQEVVLYNSDILYDFNFIESNINFRYQTF